MKKEVDGRNIKKELADVKTETEELEKRKPGQKFATPTPGHPDRVFYETLLKQKPESHMAQDWCLAYGVCGDDEAQVLYNGVCKRKGFQPVKNAPPLAASPVKKKVKQSSGGGRARSNFPKDMDADTGFEATGVFEGVGTTGM